MSETTFTGYWIFTSCPHAFSNLFNSLRKLFYSVSLFPPLTLPQQKTGASWQGICRKSIVTFENISTCIFLKETHDKPVLPCWYKRVFLNYVDWCFYLKKVYFNPGAFSNKALQIILLCSLIWFELPYIVQAGLDFVILPCQPSKGWDCRTCHHIWLDLGNWKNSSQASESATEWGQVSMPLKCYLRTISV